MTDDSHPARPILAGRGLGWLLWGACALFAALVGCETTPAEGAGPVIEEARPSPGRPGGGVTLIGRRFGLDGPASGVWLGGRALTVERWSDRTLEVRLPDDLLAADVERGRFDLVVRSDGRVSPGFEYGIEAGSPED